MKSLVVFALLLGAAGNAAAQVSSHAPTGPATSPRHTHSTHGFSLPVSDKPVAKVNGALLTDRDLLREMLQIFPYANNTTDFPRPRKLRSGRAPCR